MAKTSKQFSMEPSSIQLADVRLRLRSTKAYSLDLANLLDEIKELREYSKPLIPDLIQAINRGVYLPSTPLVDIISRLKSRELLEEALTQDGWSLNTFDRCKLLEAGFTQFEAPLLNELFQIFEIDIEPRRSAIVDALAKNGTSVALETLRVIEFRTAGNFSSLIGELNEGDRVQQEANQLEQGHYVPTRRAFLERVSLAIKSIESRPKSPVESEVMRSISQEPEIAHVLFVDLVGYSTLPMQRQLKVLTQLTEIVEGIDSVQSRIREDRLVILPTGDGMALVFFGGVKPHVDAAKELHKKLSNDSDMKLRTGLHTGPVHRVTDINGRPNISGAGINIAQRVMDCGDSGHILLSSTVAAGLRELGALEDILDDLGVVEVKHGAKLHIFNLRGEGFGSIERPSKLKTSTHELPKSAEQEPRSKLKPSEATESFSNVRSAIYAELESNLYLLHSIWEPILAAYRKFQNANHIRQALKSDAVKRISLPVWKDEKWTTLLAYAIEALTNDEFQRVDRFYRRLTRLTELRVGDVNKWRVEGELIITDLLAEGNPLQRK